MNVEELKSIINSGLPDDVVKSKISNPLLKVVALAAFGAVASYFINKQ